jgi:hypothetical protein
MATCFLDVFPQQTEEDLSVGLLRVVQEIKVKSCSHLAQTHSTHVKIVNEFTEDTNKIRLKTRKRFSTKI